MRHCIVIIVASILFPSFAMGQYRSATERPSWVNGYFSERNNSYIEVVSATSSSEDNARTKAAQIIVERRSLATGQQTSISINNGNISISGSDMLTVKSRIVDEYIEYLNNDQYRVNLLVQTAKNPTYQLEPVYVTDKYKFSPRVFVPGMAQLHKGQTARGILFIAGEAVAVGGIVAFEGLRASYQSKITRTRNAEEKQYYIQKYSNMSNIRNGFIAGAAAIYLWNIIDGAVSKGKKHVVIGDINMNISPYATPQSQGVNINATF